MILSAINTNISNKKLLEGCSRDEKEAVSVFYGRYKDLIYSAIHKWINKYAAETNRQEYVEEIFNQAFLEIMEDNFAKLKQARDKNRLSGLVFLIAYQCTGRYFKKKWIYDRRKGDSPPIFPPIKDDPGKGLMDKELIKLIDEFISNSDSIEQAVLRLRFEEGLKYHQIAARLELTTVHVGVIVNRTKEKLRIFLKDKSHSDYDF